MDAFASRLTPALVFAVAFGALAIFSQPGVYINDEVAQVASLHSLATGDLLVAPELPTGYARLVDPYIRHWGIPFYGNAPAAPVGSPLLNVLALPILAILTLLAEATSVRVAVALVAGFAVHAGARTLWILTRGAPSPRWFGPAIAAAFVPTVWDTDLPAAPYLELYALHLVSMAATAATAVILFVLLRDRVGTTAAAWACALLVVASPAMFWGVNAKYHALSMMLGAAALWAYRDGFRSGFSATFLPYAIAGLAVFNYTAVGLPLLAVLGLASLPAVRLGFKACATRVGAAVSGLAFGLIPEATYRWALFKATSGIGFIPGNSNLNESSVGFVGRLLGYGAILDPIDAGAAILRATFWTDLYNGKSMLPFVALAPWLVLAAVTMARKPLRDRLGVSLWSFVLLQTGIVLVLVGKSLVGTVGLDPRYAMVMWPGMALLAAPALVSIVGDSSWKPAVGYSAALAVGLTCFAAVWNMVLHAIDLSPTPEGWMYDQLIIHRWAGFAAFAALVVVWAIPRLKAHRAAAAAVGFSVAVGCQVWLQLLFGNPVGAAPFAAWPIEKLAKALYWMAFQT